VQRTRPELSPGSLFMRCGKIHEPHSTLVELLE
jgi:hypothetical protein